MNENSIVTVENLSFSYSGKQIYKNMSVNFPRGKITAVLGPSGTGKTTILRLIGAQLVPDAGRVLFDGQNMHSLSRRELYKARQKMSMLFQSGALFQDMTVFENTAFPLEEHTKLPKEIIYEIVMMKLSAVGMQGVASLYPSELSGGMARRAALARSIALDPELIMYDEPFVGQDPITKEGLVKLIYDINVSLGLSSIVVTHDVPEIMRIAHYVVIFSDGNVMGQGTPEEIINSSDPRVIKFIRATPFSPNGQ